MAAERWILEAFAGRGGLGEVWAAREVRSNRKVAVKVLPGETGDRAPAFLAEARAQAALAHPNIARVFDLGVLDDARAAATGLPVGAPYLVMEWAGGGFLRPAERWEVLREALATLLRALAHAHARGVLHRDLKPVNVLYGEDGGLRLVDFGLARSPGAVQGARGGTPGFMAPEQIERGAEGPWTDLYSVAATGWWLATGAGPFRATDTSEILAMQLLGALPPFEPAIAVPEGFSSWLATALQRSPADRFAGAAEALAALDDLGLAVVAPKAAPRRTVTMGATLTVSDVSEVVPSDVPSPVATHLPRRTLPIPEACPEPTGGGRPWLVASGLRLFGVYEGRLVGRRPEREVLWRGLLDASRSREPRVVVLRGPSGVGKSRLARWLVEAVHEIGVATPLRTSHARPPAADTALAELAAQLGSAGRHQQAIAALREAAAQAPVAWWIDDAQWGGSALELVRALQNDPRAGPILVVLTVQEEALAERGTEREILRAFAAAPGAIELRVPAMSDDDLAALVRDRLDLEPVTARRVVEAAAGSPLLAVRLVTRWVERDLLVETDRGLELRGRPDVVFAQPEDADVVGSVDEEALRALELAAVLGSPVRRDEWAAAAERLGVQLPGRAIAELLDRGLLIGDPHAVRFAHGQVRSAFLVSARQAGRERELHRIAAEVVLSREGPGRRAGEHLLSAGEPLRAGEMLLQVGRSLVMGERPIEGGVVLDAARAAFAAAGLPDADPRVGRLLFHEMWMRHKVWGSTAGMIAVAREFIAWTERHGGQPGGVASGYVVLALGLGRAGEVGAAVEAARRSVEIARAASPHDLGHSSAWLADALVHAGDLEGAEAAAREAVACLSVGPESDQVVRVRVQALSILASVLRRRGRHAEARQWLMRGWEQRPGHPDLEKELGYLAWDAGDLAEAEVRFGAAMERWRERASTMELTVEALLVTVIADRGRLAEAAERAAPLVGRLAALGERASEELVRAVLARAEVRT